ncbi:solute carrier family 2, facilitated glucose transporter member 6, partial [Clarias magur]
MISVIPSTAGFLMMAAAHQVWLLLLGRLLTGFAGGITASSIPVYVSEISHPGVRGALGSGPQIMAVFGSLALYLLGLVLHWRWLAVAGEVPVLIMLFLLCFMPNSPRYLITNNKRDEATRALKWLRGPESNYIAEVNQIERSVNSQVGIQWSDLKSPFFFKPILISMGMRLLQQMTGITPILVYLEPIFERTAISLEPRFDAAIVGVVRLLSVAIAAALMDKAGRKALLYTSAFIMYLATLTMTIITHKTTSDHGNITAEVSSAVNEPGVMAGSASTLIPLISIMFIIFGYAMGWGPITWLLMSEILPTSARGVASGLCVVVSWATAFALTQLFMHVVVRNGRLYFAAFSAILGSFIFGYAMVLPSAMIPQLQEDDDPHLHLDVNQISWFGIYVSEISHPGLRGKLGPAPQNMMVIGGLALYALGLVLPWRSLALFGEFPGLLMVILLFNMPHSPRYLVIKHKRDEAIKALKMLRGPDSNYIEELDQIQQTVNSQAGWRWSDLKNPFYYKPILICVLLRIFQQMTGITPILVYLEPIFEKTVVVLKPEYDAAIVGLVRLVPGIIIAFLMNKAGRKTLLYLSAMLVLTIYTHKTPCDPGNVTAEVGSATEPLGMVTGFEMNPDTLIPLISIVFIVFGYAIGWGSITWLLMSEILPMRVRGVVSGVCVMVSYITAFVLTEVFMQAVDAFGLYGPFLFFSAFCVMSIIFTAKNGRLYFAAFSAGLGSFIFGYAMVFPSAVIPQLHENNEPRLHMDFLVWGVIAGGLSAIVMNDKFGRKRSIMLSVTPLMAGFLMMATAKERLLLLMGRLLTGVAAGIAASSIPAGWRWPDLKNPFYYKPILICVLLRILQQMTGITPMLVYLEPIFEKTDVVLKPEYDAAIVGLVRLIPGMAAPFLMDKAGRKTLLYVSAMLVLTIYTHKTPCDPGNVTAEVGSATEPLGMVTGFEMNPDTLIPLISIVFIALGYAIGWGSITWLLMSEILPMQVHGVVSGVCVMVSYITAFVLTQIFMQ